MARPVPAWSVFRGVVSPRGIDFEPVGTVRAHTQGEALNLARRLDGAPRNPVVAHARDAGALSAEVIALDARRHERRSRRRGFAAVAA